MPFRSGASPMGFLIEPADLRIRSALPGYPACSRPSFGQFSSPR